MMTRLVHRYRPCVASLANARLPGRLMSFQLCICCLLVSACNFSTSGTLEGIGTPCPDSRQAALTLQPIDAQTGAPLSCLASISVRGPALDLAMSHPDADEPDCDPAFEFTAGDTAGFYDVTVEVYDYQIWVKQGIEVSQGACGVESRFISVALTAY